MITLDNASNNNTMMEAIEKSLRQRGIKFDRDGNRIRFVSLSLVFLIIHSHSKIFEDAFLILLTLPSKLASSTSQNLLKLMLKLIPMILWKALSICLTTVLREMHGLAVPTWVAGMGICGLGYG